MVSAPLQLLEARKVTVYKPGPLNVCTGFCEVLVLAAPELGSSKSHSQLSGQLSERSVKA
jgi:hypothetical protein